eukprot:1663978-Rhodomonas_salina.1
MPGTELACAATRLRKRSLWRGPGVERRGLKVECPLSLCICPLSLCICLLSLCVMSGTELAYAATRMRCDARY